MLRFRAPLGRLVVACTLGVTAPACTATLPSPPSSLAHLASPASVGAGETVVAVAATGGGSVFDPGLVGGSATVRRGVTTHTDVGAGFTGVGLVGGADLAHPPAHRGVYAGRLFVHHETVARILALHAGLGGGGSLAGGYVAGDAGATVGYENPILVPYFAASLYASLPVTKNAVDLTPADNSETILARPYFGFGPQLALGLRLPLGPRGNPFGSLFAEMSATVLFGNDPTLSGGVHSYHTYVVGTLAYQHRLGHHAGLAP